MMIHWSLPAAPIAKVALFDNEGKMMFQCLPGDEPKGKHLALLAEAENLVWALEQLLAQISLGPLSCKARAVLLRAKGYNPENN